VLVTDPQQATLFRQARFDRLEPDLEQVRRLLGLREDRDNHRRWFDVLDELRAALPRILRPRAIYRIDPVRCLEPRRLELASGAVFTGAVGQFLAHSTHVATFITTIGSAAERASRRWLRGNHVLDGTVADALASEYAEAVAQRCHDEIRVWARPQGLDVTPRYSPGYCGLNVRQQSVVFAALPARVINIRLTPSSLMVPIKSVSGLIGIGPEDKVSPEGYPCSYCDHPHCRQRRTPLADNRGACYDWGRDEDCRSE
jgi:hypothetical protein